MKRKDLTLIVVVALFSAIVSLVISHFTFGSKNNKQVKVEIVNAINPDFILPDKRYFNGDSINPTQNITIQGGQNTEPL